MPFPWKKKNCTRFSQLVADHLHSPKHGGSLVVETGFPTSLVDLFVKNRDRLKKPSKKRRSAIRDPDPSPLSLSSAESPPRASISSVSSVFVSQLAYPNDSETVADVSGSSVFVSQLEDPSDSGIAANVLPSVELGDVMVGGFTVVEEGSGVVAASGVLLTVSKMFILVALALGTKKLAFGITMSAFFLFFLDYTWKHLFRFLKPGSVAQGMLKPSIQKGVQFPRIKQDKLIVKEDDSGLRLGTEQEDCVVSDCSGLIRGHELNDQFAEIQSVQQMPNLVAGDEEIQILKERFDLTTGSKRWGNKEVEVKKGVLVTEKDCGYEVSEFETQKPRRAKIKSKLKKLVPKKFRHSNKTRSGLKGESHSPLAEDNIAMHEQEEDVDREKRELICEDKPSFSSGKFNGQEEFVGAVCSSGELSSGNGGAMAVVEGKRMPAKGNLEYMVVCMVVLVGLVGGRIFALVLTLLWCLIVKSVETLKNYKKS